MSRERTTLRQRLFARFMRASDEESDERYRERKAALLAPLRGTVVEIGPGTGVNLRFFDPSVHWIGLEPNPAMHPHLRKKAATLGIEVELRSAVLSEAGIEPGSVDAVVSTLVLCSVPGVDQLLHHIRTALKPGGSFVFLEHVADRPGTLRRLIQKSAWYTPWRYFSDGCHPGRETGDTIRKAGFAQVEFEAYMQEGAGIIAAVNRPHISGVAVTQTDSRATGITS